MAWLRLEDQISQRRWCETWLDCRELLDRIKSWLGLRVGYRARYCRRDYVGLLRFLRHICRPFWVVKLPRKNLFVFLFLELRKNYRLIYFEFPKLFFRLFSGFSEPLLKRWNRFPVIQKSLAAQA